MSYGTIQIEKMTTESGYSLGAGNASSFKNRLMNGRMEIDQRNAGASVTITAASANQYVLDRFYLRAESATGSKVSVQRSTVAPAGFINSQLVTSLSAYSIGASEHFAIVQPIEGSNMADLGWGSANAKSITISFWVRSSLTGTFGGFVLNNDANRCFVFSYTIDAANTWEYKTITIPGDTTGTWLTNNGVGAYVNFSLAAGSSVTGAAGSWSSTFNRSVTGQTSLVGTNGATFYITGTQFEVGTVATSFDFRSIGTELALCQRYFQQVRASTGHVDGLASGIWRSTSYLPVVMRATPTLSLVGSPNYLLAASTNRNLTGFAANYSIQSIVQFDGTFSSTASGTNGFPATMTTDASSYTAYIAASSEL